MEKKNLKLFLDDFIHILTNLQLPGSHPLREVVHDGAAAERVRQVVADAGAQGGALKQIILNFFKINFSIKKLHFFKF
jgi:hypothetical protein